MSCPFLKGLLSGGCTTGNDGYLVFLYEQTLVFEMRNQTALQRVANLLKKIGYQALVLVLSRHCLDIIAAAIQLLMSIH